LAEYLEQKPGKSVYNHLENHKEITSKANLIKNLRIFYSSNESCISNSYHAHDSIPTSFIIFGQSEDGELHHFLTRFNEISTLKSIKERTPAKHCLKNLWLLKPANLNQGKGIEIFSSLKNILKSIRKKPSGSTWVLQKYIERPLLIQGRKFDVRVWVLMTCRREVFFYNDGYIRTSSFEYNLDERLNFVHLTNHCLQQLNEKYGMFEDGNTLSFEELENFLNEKGIFDAHFLPRMKDLVIDCVLSSKKNILKEKNSGNFELLGFDFLIDEDFRVWLIEINTNPYLGTPNQFICELMPNMLDDLLVLTLDTMFETSYKSLRENRFELIYCESGSMFSSKPVNKRRSYATCLYPFPQLAQIPLSKSCISLRIDDEIKGPVFKDFLILTKNLLFNECSLQAEDFFDILKKIFSILKNWKKHPDEQIFNCLESFSYLFSSSRKVFLMQRGFLKVFLDLLKDKNFPERFKDFFFKGLEGLFRQALIKKYLVKHGIISALIENLLQVKLLDLRGSCESHLIDFCRNHDKNIYVPGISNEAKSIRDVFLCQGGLVSLILFSFSNEKLAKKIDLLISENFSVEELEKQKTIIKENQLFQKEFSELLILSDLDSVIVKIDKVLIEKISENQLKLQKLKREKEKLEKKNLEEEIYQKELLKEKSEKIKIYLKHKEKQIKREKSLKEKIAKLEKDSEERLWMQRKSFILEKKQKSLKKSTEIRRTFTENKALRILEQAREKNQEQHEKKFLKNWLQFKGIVEKSALRISKKKKLSISKIFEKPTKTMVDEKEQYFGVTQKIINQSIKFPKNDFPREQGRPIDLLSKTVN
jgi:hypothetical protein